jgi:hypothetical protein
MGGQLNGWLELGSSSFMMTACDLFGFLEMLLYQKRTAKPWDVLFTWLITCAVYLDFVNTFSSDDSLLIFCRIVGLYSQPHILHTDNDTSFVSTKEGWRLRCSIKTQHYWYSLSIPKEWRGNSSPLECLVSKKRTKCFSLWPNGLCMRRYVKKSKAYDNQRRRHSALFSTSLRALFPTSYIGRKT